MGLGGDVLFVKECAPSQQSPRFATGRESRLGSFEDNPFMGPGSLSLGEDHADFMLCRGRKHFVMGLYIQCSHMACVSETNKEYNDHRARYIVCGNNKWASRAGLRLMHLVLFVLVSCMCSCECVCGCVSVCVCAWS